MTHCFLRAYFQDHTGSVVNIIYDRYWRVEIGDVALGGVVVGAVLDRAARNIAAMKRLTNSIPDCPCVYQT
jgi:hypothetical protein